MSNEKGREEEGNGMKVVRTKRINGEGHIEILITEPVNGEAYERLLETIHKMNRRSKEMGVEKYSYTIIRNELEATK